MLCAVVREIAGVWAHSPLYAPAPEYLLGARVHYWTANGIFVCNISPDGTFSAVNVKQSTGQGILDQAAIAALRR